MSFGLIISALSIAFCFSCWPIIGNKSQVAGAWVGLLVSVGTLLMQFGLGFARSEYMGNTPSPRGMLLLCGAGLLNGVGCYLYARKTSDVEVPVAQFMVIVCVSMALFAPLIAWAVRGDEPTLRQCAGYIVAAVAVWLLS